MKPAVKYLSPEVYDTLELGALMFGGIGRFADEEATEDDLGDRPCCAHGMLAKRDGYTSSGNKELYRLDLGRSEIDSNVEHALVNKRGRLGFKQWCRLNNVARRPE